MKIELEKINKFLVLFYWLSYGLFADILNFLLIFMQKNNSLLS